MANTDTKIFPALLDKSLIKSLKTEAAQRETSASAIVREMLREKLYGKPRAAEPEGGTNPSSK